MARNTVGGGYGRDGEEGRGRPKQDDYTRQINQRVKELKEANFGQEPMNAREQAEDEFRKKDEKAAASLRLARGARAAVSKAVQSKIEAGRAPNAERRVGISISVSRDACTGLDDLGVLWGLNRGRTVDELVSIVLESMPAADAAESEEEDYDPDLGFVKRKKATR